MNLTIVYWALLATMLIGVAGTIIPAVPGVSLILIAILIWGIVTSFAGFSLPVIIAIVVLIFSMAIEFLGAYWGAKQMGASQWGQIGAIVGLVVGILGLLPALPIGGPLLGILVGPMLGAFLGEFFYRRELEPDQRIIVSFKAALGIVVGSLVGNIVEAVLALIAVIIFAVSTWQFVA